MQRFHYMVPLIALSVACSGPMQAQQGHGSARDAFWSASDLVSVTPNPAAHHDHGTVPRATKPRNPTKPTNDDGIVGETEMASASTPGGVAGPPGAHAKSAAQLVSDNGYGAAPHLMSTGEDRLGLRYSVLLRSPSGEYVEVRPGATFHSGDHIRLSLMANEPGYLYVIQQGSSGSWSPLFPKAGAPREAGKIEQGKVQEVPSATQTFILKEPAGEEKLFVVLSKSPIADLDRVIQGLKGKAPAGDDRSEPLEAANHIPDMFVQQMASRDLVLVDEEKVDESETAKHGGEKAVYVVSKQDEPGGGNGQVVARIELHHE